MEKIKIIKDERELREIIKYYEEDFPPAERFSTNYIVKRWKDGSIIANVLYKDNGEMLAYSFSRNLKEYPQYIYLSYLAVNKKDRSQGHGSLYLGELAKRYSDKTILLDIEFVENFEDKTDIKTRRSHFYLKNGFAFSPVSSKIWGVKYNLMTMNGKNDKQFVKDYLGMQKIIQGKYFENQVDIFVQNKQIKDSKTLEQVF